MNVYKDEFVSNFKSIVEFLDFINKIEINSKWFTDKCKNISFEALSDDTELVESLKENYNVMGLSQVVEDTISHTGLMLKLNDTPYLVRDCAIRSILARAKINGTALTKVDTKTLAKILNFCMNVADGKALLRFSEEKISAVHSAKDSDYSILNLPELFSLTNDYLQFSYSLCNFIDATFSHSISSALWSINDDSLIESYVELLELHGLEYESILPAVRLTSSDVGVSSASLFPILLIGKRQVPTMLGSCIKLEHKNGASLENFEDNLNLLHSTYQSAINKLSDLLNIKIKNPINCMIGVLKKLGLPKKISLEAMEIFKEGYEEGTEVTAHHIYLGICEIVFLMQCANSSPIQIVNTEEIIARALSFKWSDYDTTIDLNW